MSTPMIVAARRRLRPVRRAWLAVTCRLRYAAKPLVLGSLRRLNQAVRATAHFTHGRQLKIEWGWPPTPEWFDHYLADYAEQAVGQTVDAERGVYASLAVPAGGHILDLCCGDGWYSKHFYARKAASVTAVDYDPAAIAYARRVNRDPAVTYNVCDIRTSLPDGPFDGVVWSGAIEHFTEAETAAILAGLRKRMRPGALLAGDTILALGEGVHLVHHEREYVDEQDLVTTLTRVFAHACAWRSEHSERTELYFFASDWADALPFLGGKIVT